METKRIVVVGGGPAGMMAAIRAGQLNQDVTLVEKNPALGKKLLLSGKGRCNLTNTGDLETFLESFSRNGQFLRDAFKKFFNLELIEFFEKRGCKMKVERQLRVFPDSDRSASVLDVLKKELLDSRVKIIFGAALKDIVVRSNKVQAALFEGNAKYMEAERIILATGGLSFRFTGSTGEGLKIAERLGHKVTALVPALVPLVVSGGYPKRLEGLTLKNIRLKFGAGKKEIVSEIGELLFTGFGISGPLVLSLSGQVSTWLKEEKRPYVEIDLKPALSAEQLDSRLLREFKAGPTMNLKNVLKTLLPLRLIDVFIEILKINGNEKASHVTLEDRRKIAFLLKNFRFEITGTLPLEEAMITKGGVSLKDIDPRTMESRLIKGLYFAGEMIDVEADTGGFNLQAAFSTGYLAGESAALG
ncbi:MAG: NAD(P)/FAD-dependent oxidoreductase [Candidatus Omnitrophica bacterium]|nr:NAD(P)/FAD-dependent oxidoreductase [Candidatus Omnitrophota bacterium]